MFSLYRGGGGGGGGQEKTTNFLKQYHSENLNNQNTIDKGHKKIYITKTKQTKNKTKGVGGWGGGRWGKKKKKWFMFHLI